MEEQQNNTITYSYLLHLSRLSYIHVYIGATIIRTQQRSEVAVMNQPGEKVETYFLRLFT